MRLFVAIDLSDRQRAEAECAAQELQHALEKARAAKAVRWVAPAQMHLTVRFIGEVDATMGARVVETLGATLGCGAFTLALGEAGTFPGGTHPRVVWIGVEEAEGGTGAGAAHDEIERRLVALGLDAEERPFRAHLTLGRLRDPRRFSAAQFRALSDAMERLKIVPAPATVDHATLYRSHLSPKGPRYEPLARLSFGLGT